MTVQDFIAWLQTQDPQAVVRVAVQEEPGDYQSYGRVNFEPFNPQDHANVVDLRKYSNLPSQYKTTIFLDLGMDD